MTPIERYQEIHSLASEKTIPDAVRLAYQFIIRNDHCVAGQHNRMYLFQPKETVPPIELLYSEQNGIEKPDYKPRLKKKISELLTAPMIFDIKKIPADRREIEKHLLLSALSHHHNSKGWLETAVETEKAVILEKNDKEIKYFAGEYPLVKGYDHDMVMRIIQSGNIPDLDRYVRAVKAQLPDWKNPNLENRISF